MSNNDTITSNLRITVYSALFTALIIIGAYISIPIGPVPIVLSDFFVMVTGLFIGGKYGLLSVGLYLSLGALGIPVFAGGTSGLAILFGPTGGFLFGFLFLVASIGFITYKRQSSLIRDLIALLIGNVLLYAIGIPWLKISLDMSWTASMAAGLIPFLPGTIIKMLVVLALGRIMVPHFKENMAYFSIDR